MYVNSHTACVGVVDADVSHRRRATDWSKSLTFSRVFPKGCHGFIP